MTHPKTAWMFKAWTEAMLRNATVGTPDYGKKSKSTGSMNSRTTRRHRKNKRRRRKSHGRKTG